MNKVTLRDRLKKLLKQVSMVKEECKQIKKLQKELRIQNLLIARNYFQKKIISCQKYDENKQNNPNVINQLKKGSFQEKDNKIVGPFSKRLAKYNHHIHNNNQSLNRLKTKNQQIKDIKVSLIMELNQIKNMEKKQQALRKANQKIKAYNSQQKKYYRKSQDKGKMSTNLGKLGVLQAMSNYVSENKLENPLISSQVSVMIPISTQVRLKTTTLKCCRGHQYYEGQINSFKQPHGNGRLEVCCSSISKDISSQNFKDIQFYQGQFKNGKFHGYGTLTYKGGVKYVGQFKEGKRQGKGSLFLNGKVQIAKWENDAFISVI